MWFYCVAAWCITSSTYTQMHECLHPVNKHTVCIKHTNWCREQTQVLTYLQQKATMLRRHEENDYWQGQRSAEDEVTKKSACQLVLRFRQCHLPLEPHYCEINAFRYGSRLCVFMFVWFTVQLYQRKISGPVLFPLFSLYSPVLGISASLGFIPKLKWSL